MKSGWGVFQHNSFSKFHKKWKNQFTKIVNFLSPKNVDIVEIRQELLNRNIRYGLINNCVDNFWLSTDFFVKMMSILWKTNSQN